jgi:hypothetical protein
MYDFATWWMMFKMAFWSNPSFTINTIYVGSAVLAVAWLYSWSLCRFIRYLRRK